MATARPKRSREPFFWALFSAGGMLAALVLPALAVILWFALPLGWLEAPSHAELAAKIAHPLVKLALFAFITLALFHWAHRFRFTLVDLGLHGAAMLIAVLCYGAAIAGTIVAALTLWG
jgi:fumarate reductase subunit D